MWGTAPSDGSTFEQTDASKIVGVAGAMVNGDYDLSASVWMASPGRSRWFDLHYSLLDRQFNIYFNFRRDSGDFLMYFRPLTFKAWIVILSTLTAILVHHLILKRIVSEDGPSTRLFQLLGWLYFLVIHGVYSGALTTNFIIQPEVPFTTLADGLRMYPEWKLCAQKGYVFYILV